MKINLKVLSEIFPTYGVAPISNVKGAAQAIKSGQSEKAPAQYEPFLIGNDYVWNEEAHRYELDDQAIYYFAQAKFFLWVWHDVLTRAIQSAQTLKKWVQGDEKYPQGKANAFMGIYKEMTGQDDGSGGGTAVAPEDAEHNMDAPEMDRSTDSKPTNPVFHGVGSRGEKVPEPKQMDKADTLIAQAKKKMGKNGTLPSDDILDLYNQAKELKSNKLMTFIKTIKPLGEGFIKKSTLDEVIREIVKTIVKEGNPIQDCHSEDYALGAADAAWGRQNPDWYVERKKSSPEGTVWIVNNDKGIRGFIWNDLKNKWKALDIKTKKWFPVIPMMGSHGIDTTGVSEDTTTGAVAPITTPFAFKKKVTMENVREKDELKTAIRTLMNKDESKMTSDVARDVLKRKGYSDDKIASIENPNDLTTPLEEMTTTSGGGGSSAGTPGYNIPGAFSKRGGSEAGLKGAESLGYELTPIGKKDMQRHADKLLSEGDEADATNDMWAGSDDDLKAHGYTEPKMQKTNSKKQKSTPLPSKRGEAKVKGKVIHLDEDSVLQEKTVKDGTPICKHCLKPLHYAGQIECHKCGKVQ